MFDATTSKTAEYVQALAAPFIAGFAVQQGVEIISSVACLYSKLDGNVKAKKALFSIVALVLSWVMVSSLKLDVLVPFLKDKQSTNMSIFATTIFVSAGTEGFNSLLKWLSYKKDAAKATAAAEKNTAGDAVHSMAS